MFSTSKFFILPFSPPPLNLFIFNSHSVLIFTFLSAPRSLHSHIFLSILPSLIYRIPFSPSPPPSSLLPLPSLPTGQKRRRHERKMAQRIQRLENSCNCSYWLLYWLASEISHFLLASTKGLLVGLGLLQGDMIKKTAAVAARNRRVAREVLCKYLAQLVL